MHRLVVLISGNGSNLQAIIDAIADKSLDAEIALVISNKKAAFGLERAHNAGIPTEVLTLKAFKDAGKTRVEYDLELAKLVNGAKPDLVILAGFMHILSAEFLEHLPTDIINLHPALPGQFDGAHAIERAFEAYKRGEINKTGIMVHKVIPAVDRGDVVMQEDIEIQEGDSLEDLEARIHAREHKLIVAATRAVLAQK